MRICNTWAKKNLGAGRILNTPKKWKPASFEPNGGTETMKKRTDKSMPPYLPDPEKGTFGRVFPGLFSFLF